MLSKEVSSIILKSWYDITWDWTPVSRTIGEHYTHKLNYLLMMCLFVLLPFFILFFLFSFLQFFIFPPVLLSLLFLCLSLFLYFSSLFSLSLSLSSLSLNLLFCTIFFSVFLFLLLLVLLIFLFSSFSFGYPSYLLMVPFVFPHCFTQQQYIFLKYEPWLNDWKVVFSFFAYIIPSLVVFFILFYKTSITVLSTLGITIFKILMRVY